MDSNKICNIKKSFKYINGSLLDYALKKERMLEMDKSMDKKMLIDLIVTSLPDHQVIE